VRRVLLFTLVTQVTQILACGAPALAPPMPPAPVPAVAHDAAIVNDLRATALGTRCTGACPQGLTCLTLTGGYCAAKCGETCGGTCVETPSLGDVCMAACTTDRECRARDGYTCDPAWHACTLPNLAAIVPRQCPTVGPAIDATFDFAEVTARGRDPSAAGSNVAFETETETATEAATATEAETATATEAEAETKRELRIRDSVVTRDRVVADIGDAPALATSKLGTLVAWRAKPNVLISTLGGTATVVSDDCGDCAARPMLASNGAVVYALFGGDDVGLRARKSRDGGGSFEPAFAVARGSSGSAAVDRAGYLHVVTIHGGAHGGYGSAMQAIEYAVNGGAPIVVSGRDEKLPTYFAAPAIAVDDDRHAVWIAYVRGGRDADWELVIAMTRDGGKTWTRSHIGDGCAVHAVPAIAVDAKTGALHVIYYDSDAIPGRIAHAVCSSAGACTVLGAIPAPRFAAFGLGRGGARSLGEHTALVFDRGKLNAYWTQPLVDGVYVMHASGR
jgi:hypothetical protein